ncbi:MAG: PhzF family phenazine biosynthesis protein [Mycobacteriales bacterium]
MHMPTTTLHVLRVFTDETGGGGNPLGVFLDGTAVSQGQRQVVATDLAFSETVFLDNLATGELRIFTPAHELALAGHPLVGTAWLLAEVGTPAEVLRPCAGDIPTWTDGADVWIRARPELCPQWQFIELADPRLVAGLTDPMQPDHVHTSYWAWVDEDGGIIRSRVFASASGIHEDEATGSAALRLTALVGRPIEIWQGNGSILRARPGHDGTSEVGGRVVLDEVRDYAV